MIRAAAKNFAHVAVVVNPARYGQVIAELSEKGAISEEMRFRLAAEAFTHTAHYDALIAGYLSARPESGAELFPQQLSLPLQKIQEHAMGRTRSSKPLFMPSDGRARGWLRRVSCRGKSFRLIT